LYEEYVAIGFPVAGIMFDREDTTEESEVHEPLPPLPSPDIMDMVSRPTRTYAAPGGPKIPVLARAHVRVPGNDVPVNLPVAMEHVTLPVPANDEPFPIGAGMEEEVDLANAPRAVGMRSPSPNQQPAVDDDQPLPISAGMEEAVVVGTAPGSVGKRSPSPNRQPKTKITVTTVGNDGPVHFGLGKKVELTVGAERQTPTPDRAWNFMAEDSPPPEDEIAEIDFMTMKPRFLVSYVWLFRILC
jgi:hypothetical protein